MITHKELCLKGAKWLNKQASNIFYRSQFVCVELSCQGTNEIPDIIGLRPYGPVMIEVKVSRADFLKDFKKPHRSAGLPIAEYNFYLAPSGIISIEEIPANWGLLTWNGNAIEVIERPEAVPYDVKAMNYIYHSVLRRQQKPGILDYRKSNIKTESNE